MKKLSVTVKSIMALALAGAAIACNNTTAETGNAAAASVNGDSISAVASINIRYVDADSVISAYVLAQQLMEEQQRELNRLQQWHESKQRELQNLANNISQKQQNNVYLTQASMESDLQNLQKKGEEAERYFGAQQQKLAAADLQIRQRLSDSIANFIKDYNAVRGYDAILLREAGVYFKPELNITAEVIEGLNARFTGGEQAAK